MLKTNHTLTSLDIRGNGIIDQTQREKIVATDEFGRAVVKATIYNPRPTILKVIGSRLGRVATNCGLPKDQFNKDSTNEQVLVYAHTMEL